MLVSLFLQSALVAFGFCATDDYITSDSVQADAALYFSTLQLA
jgi:hypothetical protein